MRCGGKEALECLDAEELWQTLAVGTGREIELDHRPAEGIDIEEADGGSGDVTRTPSQLAFDEEVVEIAANLLGCELLGGASIVRS
jgi:hypothetical protein